MFDTVLSIILGGMIGVLLGLIGIEIKHFIKAFYNGKNKKKSVISNEKH